MLVSNWPNAIAHVDADCFYASCEQLRRPDLKGQPICVLSSQDACVVAKTYDAKAAGITTGMPVWEARKLLPRANYLSADFRYYGHLLNHAMRLSKELITKRLTARQLTVFLTLKSFDKQASTSELPYPSADYFLLASEACRALDTLYDPNQFYRACGLIASDIAVRQSGNFDLFQMAEQQREEKHLKLLETLHAINRKHGDNVLSICGAMQKRKAGGAMGRFVYPVLECG